MKQKPKKTKLLVILLLIAAILVGINGYLHFRKGYDKEINYNSRFSASEIDSAKKAAVKQCEHFTGVTRVTKVVFDEAKSDAFLTDYIIGGAGEERGCTTENSLVMFLDFKTGSRTNSLNDHFSYTNYAFILKQNAETGQWDLVDSGY